MRGVLAWALAFLSLLPASDPAFAVPASELGVALPAKILPYVETGVRGEFTARDGMRIRYLGFEAREERGALVIAPGQAESFWVYSELVYDLRESGYSIYVIDHRGQGSSDRILPGPKRRHVGYVGRFEDYVDDFEVFLSTVVDRKPHSKRFLLGHSMGGAIGALHSRLRPGYFDGVVLSAPMFEVHAAPFGNRVARSVTNLMVGLGLGSSFALGKSRFDVPERFEGNIFTDSLERFLMMKTLFEAHPEGLIHGPSYRWAQQAFRAQEMLESMETLGAPVLLLQAAEDRVVKNQAQEEFCARPKMRCTLLPLAGAKHEIFLERDGIRDLALLKFLEFMRASGPLTSPAPQP